MDENFIEFFYFKGGFVQFKLHFSYLCESTSNHNRKSQSVEIEAEVNSKEKKSAMTCAISNSLYHNTINAPSTLCLRSTVPIVSTRTTAVSAFSENSTQSNPNYPNNHEITQIFPFLYLGSQDDALSKEKMTV